MSDLENKNGRNSEKRPYNLREKKEKGCIQVFD